MQCPPSPSTRISMKWKPCWVKQEAVRPNERNSLHIPYSQFFSRALNFTNFAVFLMVVKIKSLNV